MRSNQKLVTNKNAHLLGIEIVHCTHRVIHDGGHRFRFNQETRPMLISVKHPLYGQGMGRIQMMEYLGQRLGVFFT